MQGKLTVQDTCFLFDRERKREKEREGERERERERERRVYSCTWSHLGGYQNP
jgi:hypothetical protein